MAIEADIGTYLARLDGDAVVTKNTNGKPYMSVPIFVTHVAGSGQWDKLANGYHRTLRIYLTDAAMKMARVALDVLGFDGNLAAKPLQFNWPEHGVQVKCEHDGEYENWSVVFPRRDGEAEELGDAELMALNARFRACGADGTGAPPPPPAAPEPAGAGTGTHQPISEDDIPF